MADSSGLAATITPKALSVSGSTASDKVYDATTSASITVGTLSGFIGSETVTATASGTFDSANAGLRTASATYTLVNGSNGGLAGNYALADSSGLAATITRAPLTVRANDDANFFGRSVTGTAAFNGVSYSGFVNGETSAVVTGTALVVRTGAQADAGTYFGVLVPDTSTLNAANYSFTPASGNYTIVPANQLLLRVQNSGITYGTTPSYTITSAQYLTSDNTTVRSVIPSGSGTTFMADGATFTVAPTGSNNTSNAGFIRVGSYQLGGNVTSGSSVNFNNNLVVVGSLEVSSTGLTASASGVTKVYDGTTSMTGVTLGLSTLKAGDVVTVNGQGAFSSRSVGTNLSYSISALSLSGADAGNYHLTGGSSFSGSNGQITPASAFVTGSTTNLTYSGLTQHQIAPTSSGFLAGDSITISGAASGKDAGTYQSNLTVSGTDVGNYSVTVTNANLLIGKASLTLSGTRTYDGGTTFAGQYLTATGVNGETFTVTGSGSSSNLASKNVSANPLGTTLSSVDGLSLGSSSNGGQSANYNVLGTTGSSIGLTKANLSITATPSLAGNIYNGSPFYGTYTITALSADTASLIVSGMASGTHAGTYTSNLMVAGSALANYNTPIITNADLVISPKAVTVTNTSRSSTYDGSSTYGSLASGMTFTTSALIGQDSVASVTQTATGVTTSAVAQAGNFSVIPSLAVMGTGLASNYSFSYAASTHSVNKASLQVSANNASKTYDAAAYSGGNGVSYTGLVGGESASVLGGTLSYGGSSQGATNVGSYTITPSGLSSNNYAITYASGTLTISPAALTAIAGTLTGSVNKVYDGTNTATLDSTNFQLSGWMGSDGASVTKTTGTYDSKSVGTGKTVTVNLASSDYAPTGSTVLANYSLPTTITGAVGAVTPAALSISGITASSKTYDGTTGAVVSTAGVVKAGLMAGDVLNVSVTGSFADKNAGTGKTVNLSSSYSGADAANYTITDQSTTTADIARASLQVSANNASKTYDAAAYSGGNGVSYTGLVGGESASVLGGTLSYGGSSQGATNVGSYTITPSGLSSNNYAITYASGTLTISPAALTAIAGTLTGSVNKVYDGTNTATLDSTNFQLSGWMGSDGASVTKTTGTYDSKSVGTGKTVTVNLASSDYAPTGSTVLANYSLPTTITGAVGAVTPAALSISGITAVDKVYDGTTAAMINTTGAVKDGLITGDIVNIVASGAFADKNVGNAKVVSISDMALTGLDAVNYRLVSSSASSSANISKADLQVIGAAASNKSFDGSRSATVIGGRIAPFGSDAVSLSAANATFNDESIGINKPVSTFYTLTGADAGNYTVVQPNGLAASINPNPASTPTVQQIVVTPAVTVSVIPPSVPLVAVSSDPPTVSAATGTTASSGTEIKSIGVTGSITPFSSSTTSGGGGTQGNTSFVAVKTFDVVKVAPGTSFSLSLPDNTFTHSVSSTPLQISATTASGNPLPDWLQFSPGERRFTGTAPVGVTSLQVLVVATDTNGNQASTTLTLQFGDPSR